MHGVLDKKDGDGNSVCAGASGMAPSGHLAKIGFPKYAKLIKSLNYRHTTYTPVAVIQHSNTRRTGAARAELIGQDTCNFSFLGQSRTKHLCSHQPNLRKVLSVLKIVLGALQLVHILRVESHD